MKNNKVINHMMQSYMPDLEQIRENCHRKVFATNNTYSRQLVGLAVALMLIIGGSTIAVFTLGGGDNDVSPNAYGMQNLNNHLVSELFPITIEDAQTIIDNYYTYSQRIRYVGEGIIEKVQGEIKDPSVGLSSRIIEQAVFPDVFFFESDGTDFYGKHQLIRYAVSKMGGILYEVESWHSSDGENDVWVAMTGGFVVYNKFAKLPELVIYNISSTGLSYTLKNATTHEFIYGSDFQLHIRNGNKWESVDNDLFFTSEGYTAMPQSYTLEQNVDFERILGKLPAGEYKFIKNIMDFRGTIDYNDYNLSQIFIIKDTVTEDVKNTQ